MKQNIIKKAVSKAKTGAKLIKRGFVEDPVNAYLTGLFTASLIVLGATIVGVVIDQKAIGDATKMYNSGLQTGRSIGEINTSMAMTNYLIGQGKTKEEAFNIVNSLVNSIQINN